MNDVIPASHLDLLERPLYVHLATIRPDGTPQVNPMWASWDGEFLSFTTSTKRAKHANLRAHPEVAVSVNDPENPYRYLEVRGVVERIEPDPTAAFFFELADRYGLEMKGELGDAPYRVRVYVRPAHCTSQ